MRFLPSSEYLTKGCRKVNEKQACKTTKRARGAAEPYLLKRCNGHGGFLHRREKGRSRECHSDGFVRHMIIISSKWIKSNACIEWMVRAFLVSARGQKSGLLESVVKLQVKEPKRIEVLLVHILKWWCTQCCIFDQLLIICVSTEVSTGRLCLMYYWWVWGSEAFGLGCSCCCCCCCSL